MNCDKQRPCSRCIKRDIGHLCTSDDVVTGKEPSQGPESEKEYSASTPYVPDGYMRTENKNSNTNLGNINNGMNSGDNDNNNNNLLLPPQPNFVSENVGSEFSSLNEFLMMLENPLPMDSETNIQGGYENRDTIGNAPPQFNENFNDVNTPAPQQQVQQPQQQQRQQQQQQEQEKQNDPGQNKKKRKSNVDEDDKPTSKEQFFLTAADPSTEMTPEDRLKLVINAKLEAGLLKPYDYAKGYARLQEYMDKYMSHSSKQRILKPLMSIRPAFRTIAKSLKDVDLVLVEESFERMLLSYDRVFTSMSMPACLWRRTGEIYRANKEFASLVDCTVDDLRDGKLAIYELMTEESAVNFWEKYGSIAFDKGQKAVLTSCSLRTKDGSKKRPCCFSFTIRRDRYNIPICIVGNFIPLSTTTEQKV